MNAGKVILINSAYSLLQPKGCEAFGRFFLCLIAMASHRRATMKGEKIPVHIFIDEIENYLGTTTADSNFTGILEQCRKQKVAMTVAHQYLSQLGQRTIDTLQGVAIKCASALTDRDAHTMARGMRTKPEFLEQQARGSFALFVRNTTTHAISIKVPFGVMEAMPRMSQSDQERIRDTMRERYSAKTHDAPAEAEASRVSTRKPAEPAPLLYHLLTTTPPIKQKNGNIYVRT
ncbi:MAG: hypothetical protein DLM68_03010 [Hyphomicrobiales bacterium]|nr:MAG: hypothetical protein DLM68_03010 [Hyphomicrobiales bacterium]